MIDRVYPFDQANEAIARFARGDKSVRVPLQHGDVVVWGGVDRMRFHGVLPVKPGVHELLGERRINLTFRKVR